MSLMLKIQMFFVGKGNYIRFRFSDPDKRIRNYYVRVKENMRQVTIESRSGTYMIDPNKIYYEDGFRTLFYKSGDPIALDINDFDRRPELSDKMLRQGIDEEVTRQIISSSSGSYDGVFKSIKTFLFFAIGATVIVGLINYSMVSEFIEQYQTDREVLDAIRQLIADGYFD